jgi:hypothetical protein
MNENVMSWWPGEDVVGTIGCSRFSFDIVIRSLRVDRRQYNKKRIIAEAAPQVADLAADTVESTDDGGNDMKHISVQEQWSRWSDSLFAHFKNKADIATEVAYINVHWSDQPMWQESAGLGY